MLLKNEKRYTRESQTSAHGDSVGWWPWEVQIQRLPPTSVLQTAEKRKDFYSISSWAGGLLEVLFRLPPFLRPQLLSNQPSLPPPPASLDTHTPSNKDLPPTRTPPNHFPSSSSVGKVQRPSLLRSFAFRRCLSADLSLASERRMRGMHWCGRKDNLALLLWESRRGTF